MRILTRRRSRERGSALLVASVMIFMSIALIGALLAAPQAELQRAHASAVRESTLAAADAGIRAGGVQLAAWRAAGTLVVNAPKPTATNPAQLSRVFVGSATSTQLVTALSSGMAPSPAASEYPSAAFASFGANGGQYAFCITMIGTNTYQVDAIGRTPENFSTQVARVEAVYFAPPPPPGWEPTPFTVNPTNGAGNTNSVVTSAGNGGAKGTGISAIDLSGQVSSVSAISGPSNTTYGGGNPVVTSGGAPTVQQGLTAVQLSAIQSVVAAASALPTGSGTLNNGTPYNSYNYTSAATWSTATLPTGTSLNYVNVPTGVTLSSTLFSTQASGGSGNSVQGLLIINLQPGAIVDTSTALFAFSGNHPYSGGIVFYQQGAITMTGVATSVNIATANGDGSKNGWLQYNSAAIQTASSGLVAGPNFAIGSYNLVQ